MTPEQRKLEMYVILDALLQYNPKDDEDYTRKQKMEMAVRLFSAVKNAQGAQR